MKTKEKEEAIALRKLGNSMNDIAQKLGVAKSSVSLWTRHLEIDPVHKERISSARNNRTIESYKRSAERTSETARAKRLDFQKIGTALTQNDGFPLFTLGCMLYWCEGQKSKNSICLANADPEVILVFLRFLRECLGIENSAIKIRINGYLNNGISQEQIEDHWLSISGLTRENLGKGTFDTHSAYSSKRKRNLIYGTAYVTVCSTEKLHQIYGGIASVCGKESKFLF